MVLKVLAPVTENWNILSLHFAIKVSGRNQIEYII